MSFKDTGPVTPMVDGVNDARGVDLGRYAPIGRLKCTWYWVIQQMPPFQRPRFDPVAVQPGGQGLQRGRVGAERARAYGTSRKVGRPQARGGGQFRLVVGPNPDPSTMHAITEL